MVRDGERGEGKGGLRGGKREVEREEVIRDPPASDFAGYANVPTKPYKTMD